MYMIVVKILSALLGIVFLLFGYFIFFCKKYNFINGFSEDFKCGRKTERYAATVGLAEFIFGVVLLMLSVLLFLFV